MVPAAGLAEELYVTASLRTSPAQCAIRAIHKKTSPVKSEQKLSFSPRSVAVFSTLYTQQPSESLHFVDLQPLKEKQSWMGMKVLPTWKMHTSGMFSQMISKLVIKLTNKQQKKTPNNKTNKKNPTSLPCSIFKCHRTATLADMYLECLLFF